MPGQRLIVFYKTVRREVGHVRAEVMVKPIAQRPAPDRPGEIDPAAVFLTLAPRQQNVFFMIADVGAVLEGPIHAQVPLADACSGVAVLLEHPRDREPVFFDQWQIPIPYNTGRHTAAPAVAPGQQPVAGGRADRRGGVRIGERHALHGKPVDVGRGDLRVGIEALWIAVAHIVGEKNDDVGLLGGGLGGGSGEGKAAAEQ